jgi:hypothetical protein
MTNAITHSHKAISTDINSTDVIALKRDTFALKAMSSPANHNLTRQAREANVIPFGGHHVAGDFRPDIGARLARVA